MTASGDSRIQQAVHRALFQEAGPDADAKVLAAAAVRLYDRLAQQFAPLIGDTGVTALFARSVNLSQREFPWLDAARDSERSEGPFAAVGSCLERQEPAVASQAVAALFATFGGLLMNMIGDRLTTRFLRQAWPSGFSDEADQETHP